MLRQLATMEANTRMVSAKVTPNGAAWQEALETAERTWPGRAARTYRAIADQLADRELVRLSTIFAAHLPAWYVRIGQECTEETVKAVLEEAQKVISDFNALPSDSP